MPAHNVVIAPAEEQDQVASTITAAFIADPLLRWMYPDPHQYLVSAPRMLAPFGGAAFKHGTAYRSSDFHAASLWLPPGVHSDEKALGKVMSESVNPALREDLFGFMEQVGQSHPAVEHWYLPVIGVDPTCQGMGYGSALLAHALEVCDRDHMPAYLESSNAKNIPLYERFGFEVTGELQFGSSPAIWPMLRAAR